jgi:cardiolipin synthase
VSDGTTAFIGGMNIGDRHLVRTPGVKNSVEDIHFRLEGPVVSQIEQIFLEDWAFSTGESLAPSSVRPAESGTGAVCRSITDGPNEDLGKLSVILAGALSCARERIAVMTPYFLPSREMIAGLQSAALRGVQVDVILPGRNNLPFVHWATRNMLWELLQWGVNVFYQPPPFVHSKLLTIDDAYALVGSANLDPRSLRLNFELALEIFHKPTVETLNRHIRSALSRSKPVPFEEVENRPFFQRIRDSLAWLFTPYL